MNKYFFEYYFDILELLVLIILIFMFILLLNEAEILYNYLDALLL